MTAAESSTDTTRCSALETDPEHPGLPVDLVATSEGPVVLRKDLPQDVKDTMIALVDGLHEKDADCAYGVAAGESLGFDPITHDAYLSVIEARKAKIGG